MNNTEGIILDTYNFKNIFFRMRRPYKVVIRITCSLPNTSCTL